MAESTAIQVKLVVAIPVWMVSAAVALSMLFAGISQADDGWHGQPPSPSQLPEPDLFMVPDSSLGQLPASAQRIHAYTDRILVRVDADQLPDSVRRVSSRLEDIRYLSYRSWQGPVDDHDARLLAGQDEGYFLAALIGPVDAAWRQQIESSGLTIVDHVHPYGLLLRGNADHIVSVAGELQTSYGVAVITHALPLPHRARLGPDIAGWLDGRLAPVEAGMRTVDEDALVRIVFHHDADLATAHDRVRNILSLGPEYRVNRRSGQFSATAPGLARVLQEVPEVAYVHGEYPRQLHNNLAAKDYILNTEPVWNDPALGYTGAGIIVGVNDSGLDLTHPDFPAGSVVATKGVMSQSGNHHGTHVTGSVAGRGANSSPTNTSGCGDVTPPLPDGRGMAWGAWITHDNIFSGGSSEETEMMQWHAQHDALLTNNSWGYGSIFGPATGYIQQTVDVDIAVRDADPSTGTNYEMVIVFSAGNDGPGSGTISAPANAKNVITVGASQNDRCGSYITGNPDIDAMAPFSSRGPSQQRIKPDLVAPGTDVLSSDSAQEDSGWDQNWTGEWYSISPGTSMSSPLVTGAATVFMESHLDRHGYLPSPALLKAALINNATDMGAGFPSNDQGWGRLDLHRAIVGPVEDGIVYFDQGDVSHLETGESWATSIVVSTGDEPFKVSLVWTDPAGASGCNPCHINDLDLLVTAPDGTVYRGNQFSGAWSTPDPAGRDGFNNVENVFVQSPTEGEWQIEVVSVNTSQNPLRLQGQDFALVMTGALGGAGIEVDPVTASVCGTQQTTEFTITLSEQFDGVTAALSADGLPTGTTGSFEPNPVDYPDQSIFTISGLSSASSGDYLIEMTATDTLDAENTATTAAGLRLFADVPGQPALISPPDSTLDVALRPTLSWSEAPDAATYLLEVATDSDFASIVYATSVASTSHTLPANLDSLSTYFWRVTPSNLCGEGATSPVFEFTTIGVVCELVESMDVPKTIEDATGGGQNVQPTTTESELSSHVHGELHSVSVIDLRGSHSHFNDLHFDLVSPNDTVVRIMNRSCGGNIGFDLSLADDAAGDPGDWPCPPDDGETHVPSNPLAGFIGEEATGTWRLGITDNVRQVGGGSTGTLEGWGLNICVFTSDKTISETTIGSITPAVNQVVGEAYAVAVSVSGDSPSGTVTVDDGDGNNCTISLPGGTSCDLTSTTTGTKTITADYEGDDNNTTSSDTTSYEIVQAESTTSIDSISPADQQTVGEFYTVTVSIDGYTPTGTVTVDDGDGNACNITLPDTSCALSSTTTGIKTITASYGGDANNTTSSDTASYEIVDATSETTIDSISPADQQTVGESYTVAVSVSGDSPTGTVDVDDGDGNDCTITLPDTSCALTSTTTGTKTITASYGGDANNTTSSDTASYEIVQAESTTMIDSISPVDQQTVGEFYTVTVSIDGYTPTGTVTVDDGDGNDCTITLPDSSCALSSTTTGTKTITASYGGDANNTTSSDTASYEILAPGPAALAVITSPESGVVGSSLQPELVVQVRDEFGEPVSDDNSTVIEVVLETNPTGAVLSGTLVKTVSGGEASFDDLSLDRAGEGFRLEAIDQSGELAPALSEFFDVVGDELFHDRFEAPDD